MAVDLEYYLNGDRYTLSQDSEGFWQSKPNPFPTLIVDDFYAIGSNTSDAFEVKIDGVIGDWFQVDSIKLYGIGLDDDTYKLPVVSDDFIDDDEDGEVIFGEGLGEIHNPQLYNEVAKFDNQINELLVPINEFVTHSTFNDILGKMYENYKFLIDKSTFLSVPPNDASYRYGVTNSEIYPQNTNVWISIHDGYSQYWDYNRMDAKHVAGLPESMIFASNTTLSATTSLSAAVPDIATRDYFTYGTDYFTDIKSVEVDSREFIWVLDDTGPHGKVGIFSFDDHWKYESTWEYTDPTHDKYLKNPTDLKISDGIVYITSNGDSDERASIRIYTDGGSHIHSIICPSSGSNIDSIAITTDYIIALSDNKLHKFDKEYNYVDSIDLFERIKEYNYADNDYIESEITRLCNNTNGFFFYGIAGNLIYKFGQSGEILESFGELVVKFMNTTLDPINAIKKPVNDVYHDKDYTLYAASDYDIIRYYDRVLATSKLLDDKSFNLDNELWTVDEVDVNTDEYTTAWVYNRIFDRILDNLNMFRLALRGSQVLIKTATFEHVEIGVIRPNEFKKLPYVHDDIVIGINELHCEGAINRCIRQLYECFEVCLGYLNIKNTSVDSDTLEIYTFDLIGQSPITIYPILIDDVYYYERGIAVENLKFKWTDTITYRADISLSTSITLPSNQVVVDLTSIGNPMQYEDTVTPMIDSGTHSWTLTENYGPITRTEDITVSWASSIYAGTISGSISNIHEELYLTTPPNMQWQSISQNLDTNIRIVVTDGKPYYIAVPKDVYDDGNITINQVGYDDDMEYIFTADGNNQYHKFDRIINNIEYYIFTDNDPVMAGVTYLKFNIKRNT